MQKPHERELARKEEDVEWKWMNAPGWWVNMFMTRPLRRAASMWEREVEKIKDTDDLEDVDTPNNSKKPHVHYW